MTEIHVERLLGRKVHDVDGRLAGRIEELIVIFDGGHSVVAEYHLGSAAMLERLMGAATSLPFFGWLAVRKSMKVRWDQIDLTDSTRPRLNVRCDVLDTV